MQEPKKVQFDIKNNTNEPISINLFDSSVITNQNVSTSSIIAGTIDTSFVYGTGFDNSVNSIAIQTNGKIIVGGFFNNYNGTPTNKIIRLNTNGSIDTSFVYGTGFDGLVDEIAIQSDGKILVGGNFLNYDGTPANYIIRLNSNGTIDGSFVYGTGFDANVRDIAIQSDGKILVGGNFLSYNGTPANNLIRLNSDGTIDGSFVYGLGFNSTVNKIAIQSDGKIVLGGNFTSYNLTPANGIIRLNSDGSIDTFFIYGTGFNFSVVSIDIQTNGKIIVGGVFNNYNGTGANRIIRLNTDGSVDTSFVYGTGFNFPVLSIAIQSDGKILVGGQFGDYNGTPANLIIRLNSDGSVDTSFVYGIGFNGFATIEIAIKSDGKIVVGGNFISYDGTPANYIAILNNNTVSYIIEGGSVDYNFFVQGLNNDPKKIEEIELIMPQTYLANPVNVQYLDASGNSDLKPYLPNIEIDAFQKATNRAIVKFGDEYVMNINTQIVDFIIPPFTTTILVITYTELLKSDMLDMVIYEDENKAKYKINQSLDGKISAKKYWGAKKMPKELSLSSDWLKEMRKRFQKVEVIEYDQPKLAGGTAQTKEVYQDLFGFSKQVKAKRIGITKAPKFKKGVKVKLATKKQPIKPVAENVQVEEVFQDMLRVNAHEIPLEKIIPTEIPIDKQPIKPRPVEMTTEQVFQEMLSVNAHEIKLNKIKVPKIKGVKPIQIQLDDLSPMDVFNRSFEDYGSGYLVGVKNPVKEEESKDKYAYGVYYIKPIDDRFTAFRHSGDIPMKIELTNNWFKDLKRKFDDIKVIAIVKNKK